jgi:Domain of unknown function (DUF4402)
MNIRSLRSISVLALSLAALSSGSAWAAAGSATGTNTAKSLLIRPVEIISNLGLDFGTLAKGVLSGPVTVTIDPLVGQYPAITSSDPSAVKPLRGHTDATFTVHAEPGEVVQVSSPSSITLRKGSGGSEDTEMTISNLLIDIWDGSYPDTDLFANGSFTMPAEGYALLEVGGTLTVQQDDQPGQYDGTFNVTVSYL